MCSKQNFYDNNNEDFPDDATTIDLENFLEKLKRELNKHKKS